MTTVLTHVPTGESVTLRVVTQYDTRAATGTIVHTVIGATIPDLTLKPVQARAGTFEFLCRDEVEALALYQHLRRPGPFSLLDSGTTIVNLGFHPTDDLELATDPQTQRVTMVRTGFQAVTL